MSCLLLVLAAISGCGDANAGTGGSGGTPRAEQSSYRLSCTIDTLILEIPIELTYQPDRPWIAGAPVDLSVSAAVIFDEAFSESIIDAGVSKIDIMVIDVASAISGATPSVLETSLADGINDFDLIIDTDDDGAPGPHRLELETATTTVSVDEDATAVEIGLGLDGVFFMMGDFEMPDDCLNPTLVGFAARFLVEPSR